MPAYLIQCACFQCRKSFKRSVTDWESRPPCPNCGCDTHVMGRYFRPPPTQAIKQWRKVAMLYLAGVRFAGTQSGDLGQFPDTLLEARAFIQRNGAILSDRRRRFHRFRAQAVEDEQRQAEKRRMQAARRRAKLKRLLTAGDGANGGPPHDKAEGRIRIMKQATRALVRRRSSFSR